LNVASIHSDAGKEFIRENDFARVKLDIAGKRIGPADEFRTAEAFGRLHG
jgi:hypothetical protein